MSREAAVTTRDPYWRVGKLLGIMPCEQLDQRAGQKGVTLLTWRHLSSQHELANSAPKR